MMAPLPSSPHTTADDLRSGEAEVGAAVGVREVLRMRRFGRRGALRILEEL